MKIKHILLMVTLLFACYAHAKTVSSSDQCKNNALIQAEKLLTFHFGDEDDRMALDTVTLLPSITNPANNEQRFDVLEIWGYIYKGQYRMRLIYYPMEDGHCVLMGQELLEYASL